MTLFTKTKKIFHPLREHKSPLAILLVRACFFALIGPIYALMMKNIITSLQNSDTSTFLFSLAVIAGCMTGVVLFSYIVRNALVTLRLGIQKALYKKYLNEYLALENTFTERLGTGKINNIFQKGCDNWMSLLSNFPLSGFSYIIKLLAIFSMMGYYIGRQGLGLVVIVFAISFSIAQWGNKKTGVFKKGLRDYYTAADRDIVKVIMSKGEINQNQQGRTIVKKIGSIFQTLLAYEVSISKSRILSFDLQRGSIMGLQLFFLFYIGYGVLEGQYELGLVALFRMLSNQINNAIEEINNYITNFHTQIIYIEKLWDTFDDAPRMQALDSGKGFALESGDIVLDNISFAYLSEHKVLENFSLSITAGTKVALVGESGSGKSTLLKLISAYIKPDLGKILVDNQDLAEIKLADYYRHIAYLTQEPSVFDGTIYENLTFALDTLPDDVDSKIREVLLLSKCEFVYEFADGLQTEIGEKGVRLSGGQKQRLAIAKVMLKNPSIILLDEPTSALDSFNEDMISQALSNLFAGKTVIVVAHRLQTVKNSDTILYIQSGKVVEEGTHDQLILLGGLYKKMLDLQSGF